MSLSTEQIKEYIVDNFDLEEDEFDFQSKLFTSGLLDSLTMMELITYMESEAGLRFKALDINLTNLDTIESMVNYLAARA